MTLLSLWSIVGLSHHILRVITAAKLESHETSSPSTIGNALAVAVVGFFLSTIEIVRQFTTLTGRFKCRRGCERRDDRRKNADFSGFTSAPPFHNTQDFDDGLEDLVDCGVCVCDNPRALYPIHGCPPVKRQHYNSYLRLVSYCVQCIPSIVPSPEIPPPALKIPEIRVLFIREWQSPAQVMCRMLTLSVIIVASLF
jgi:hypothetical protein